MLCCTNSTSVFHEFHAHWWSPMPKWKFKVVGDYYFDYCFSKNWNCHITVVINPNYYNRSETGWDKFKKIKTQLLFTNQSSKEQNHDNNSKISYENNPWAITSDKTLPQQKQEYPPPPGKQCPKVKLSFVMPLPNWNMKLSQHLWLFLLMVTQPSFHRQRQSRIIHFKTNSV